MEWVVVGVVTIVAVLLWRWDSARLRRSSAARNQAVTPGAGAPPSAQIEPPAADGRRGIPPLN